MAETLEAGGENTTKNRSKISTAAPKHNGKTFLCSSVSKQGIATHCRERQSKLDKGVAGLGLFVFIRYGNIYNALFFLLFLAVVIVQVIQGTGGQDKQRSADPGDIVKIDKP